jgi:hypothetical protein
MGASRLPVSIRTQTGHQIPHRLPGRKMEEIAIVSVDDEGITMPQDYGKGSAVLYSVPFKLNQTPSSLWCDVFVQTWNSNLLVPYSHKQGIARVEGDKIILDGTTIEEVEDRHKDTLKHCIAEANRKTATQLYHEKQKEQEEQAERERRADILKNAQEKAKKIKF